MNEDIREKMVVSHPLQHKVIYKMVECLEKAKKTWGEKVSIVPDLKWETKGRAAGWAHVNWLSNEWWININPILFNENTEEMLNQTIPHEMAHLIAYMVFGRGIKPHGREWQWVMRVLGVPPKRCHNLDVSSIKTLRRQVKRYDCPCQKCQKMVPMTARLLAKMERGAVYVHKGCGGRIGTGKVLTNRAVFFSM